jgi:hypothetical protein
MKTFFSILAIILLTGLDFAVVLGKIPPATFANHPLFMDLILALFGAGVLGGWTMFITIFVRREKHPIPLILISVFIPNSFIWYFFGRNNTRPAAGNER